MLQLWLRASVRRTIKLSRRPLARFDEALAILPRLHQLRAKTGITHRVAPHPTGPGYLVELDSSDPELQALLQETFADVPGVG